MRLPAERKRSHADSAQIDDLFFNLEACSLERFLLPARTQSLVYSRQLIGRRGWA
jgi:hypothetical protein